MCHYRVWKAMFSYILLIYPDTFYFILLRPKLQRSNPTKPVELVAALSTHGFYTGCLQNHGFKVVKIFHSFTDVKHNEGNLTTL